MPYLPQTRPPLYRAFHYGANGGIVRADIVEAVDDEEAIARVRTLMSEDSLELWDRTRFVVKIDGASKEVYDMRSVELTSIADEPGLTKQAI